MSGRHAVIDLERPDSVAGDGQEARAGAVDLLRPIRFGKLQRAGQGDRLRRGEGGRVELDHAAGGVRVCVGLLDAVDQVARVARARAGVGEAVDRESLRGAQLVSPDIHGAVHSPRESGAALVGGEGLAGGGVDGQAYAAGIDRRAAWLQGDGLGGAAVAGQRKKPRVDDATWLCFVPSVKPPDPPVPIKL